MDLVLVRHAHYDAHNSGALSAAGREAARCAAVAIAERLVVSELWTSPLTRAVQSGELLAYGLGFGGVPRICDFLTPDGSHGTLLHELSLLPSDAVVVVVSHEPYVSTAAALLLSRPRRPMTPASAIALALEQPSRGSAHEGWRWDSGSSTLDLAVAGSR